MAIKIFFKHTICVKENRADFGRVPGFVKASFEQMLSETNRVRAQNSCYYTHR